MTFFFDVSRQKPLFKVVFQDGFPTRILVESRPGPWEKKKTKKNGGCTNQTWGFGVKPTF